MAIDRSPYRHAYIDRPEQLRRAGVSVLAERLYCELERGRWSNMAGLCWWEPQHVRVSLREHSAAKIDAALSELERAEFVSVDRQLRVVVLPSESRGAAECGPNHRQGMRAICQTFPPCAQVDLVLQIIEEAEKGLARPMQAVGKTSGVRNRSKEQEQDMSGAAAPTDDKPKRKPTLAQQPPTLAETIAHFRADGCDERRAAQLADACLTYWTSQGFHRKSGPIADWKATCRTWRMNDDKPQWGSSKPALPNTALPNKPGRVYNH